MFVDPFADAAIKGHFIAGIPECAHIGNKSRIEFWYLNDERILHATTR